MTNLVKALYRELVVEQEKRQTFWILTAFIITFAVARLVVRLVPNIALNVSGTHIHHFTYGFILLALSGYIAIVTPSKSPSWVTVLYGVGLALAVDEAGMWLRLTNHYYNEASYDAIILIAAVLINAVYFRTLWIAIFKLTLKIPSIFFVRK
jgi:hypothetical protein